MQTSLLYKYTSADLNANFSDPENETETETETETEHKPNSKLHINTFQN